MLSVGCVDPRLASVAEAGRIEAVGRPAGQAISKGRLPPPPPTEGGWIGAETVALNATVPV